MKELLLLFISSSLLITPITSSPAFKTTPRFLSKFSNTNKPLTQQNLKYETQYFTQTLDHFTFSNLPTFQQRYLINSNYWSGPLQMGPIFFYCGNEGDIEWFAANTGFVWEIAPRFNALVVFPEHRYYGESMPFGSREKAYENASSLAYLTTEQAIADFAVLVTDLKWNLSAKACPVVFGGSYGGMLAAWMRLKYPHIAMGALASSAPILQFEDIVPSETFYDIVSRDFMRESSSCFDTIKKSWGALEVEGMKDDGLVQMSSNFRLCQRLNNTKDLSDWLSSAYSYLAMVDYPYPSEFLMPLPANPIKEVCREIDSYPNGTSVLERIFAGVSIYYNYTGTVDCFDLGDDPHGMSGWDWQAKQCIKEFGIKPRPQWVTTEFGGHDIRTTLRTYGSNIIFSNGLLDPWSGGGVLQNVSETIVALVTAEGMTRE
ncbi:hypothetical protein GIB67_015294 [Kingdonia uniflora]|uniref:Lysosomal Pro-X carboxypeptidase n=1 Tax=Kingdonia uniflora TaxID=39325 RepID=A0A7J7MTF6_9MAGN|nr:hypothetical protein GIB67_015294 [Kingdonia uniflora]